MTNEKTITERSSEMMDAQAKCAQDAIDWARLCAEAGRRKVPSPALNRSYAQGHAQGWGDCLRWIREQAKRAVAQEGGAS